MSENDKANSKETEAKKRQNTRSRCRLNKAKPVEVEDGAILDDEGDGLEKDAQLQEYMCVRRLCVFVCSAEL